MRSHWRQQTAKIAQPPHFHCTVRRAMQWRFTEVGDGAEKPLSLLPRIPRPLSDTVVTHVPAAARTPTEATSPAADAQCKAVSPVWLASPAFAPDSRRARTAATPPLQAASCSGGSGRSCVAHRGGFRVPRAGVPAGGSDTRGGGTTVWVVAMGPVRLHSHTPATPRAGHLCPHRPVACVQRARARGTSGEDSAEETTRCCAGWQQSHPRAKRVRL